MLSSRFLSRETAPNNGQPLQNDSGSSATSSFFSSILTSTTSKYNNLRRQLISSEADGDTEDDSHISRVLRAYYMEKQQRLPEWLPPDPKAPPPPPPTQFVSSNMQGQGMQQQGGPQQGQQQGMAGRWGKGGLSDLWDSGNKGAQPQEPDSLRQRPGVRQSNSAENAPVSAGGRFAQQQAQQGRPSSSFQQVPETQARPLPSQRAGSYQSQQPQASSGFQSRFGSGDPSPPTSAGSGTTAQERLKARLWGAGRSNSPTNSMTSSASSNTGASASGRNPYADQGAGGRNPYADQGPPADGGRFGSGGGRPAAGERDRFGGSGGRERPGGSGVSYGNGGGYGGAAQQPRQPVVSANAPWAGGGDEYAYSGDGGNDGRASGLPSGPRAGRQGQGLPSGPRPRRF